VIDPSGPSREGNASRYEAAGGSPTSGVNAVYDDRALAADTLSIEPPADGGEAADGEAVDDEAGRTRAGRGTGKRQRSRRRGRSARQRRSWRLSFFALAMAGVVALAAWALFGSRLLVVRTVQITGTRLVPRSAVLAAAGVEPGAPLIEVNAGQVASRIDAIRQVRSAQVTRSWPDRLVIVVHERSPAVAVTAPGGGWDMVDADGVIVTWATSRPASLPVYTATVPVTALRDDPDLGAAAAVLAGLPAQLRGSVKSVSAPSPDQVTFQLAGGITVVWGGTDRTAAKAQELTALERTGSHYYDVSAAGVLVTK
jgi:cell division protein FtsQ